MSNWLVFILGFGSGLVAGVLLTALMAVSKRSEEEMFDELGQQHDPDESSK